MRLITRADFDGLICAVLLSAVQKIDAIFLTHASDIHRKKIAVNESDIIANLPYDERCGIWFDHHTSEQEVAKMQPFTGKFAPESSCAQVIFDFFADNPGLKPFRSLVEIANQIDSAQLAPEDVHSPKGWHLISETLQPFYTYPNLMSLESYFRLLVSLIAKESLAEIFEKPAVRERLFVLQSERRYFKQMLLDCSEQHGNVVITDIRDVERSSFGNRFLVYSIFPEQNISINMFKPQRKNVVVLACGHSIFKRDSQTHIGNLLKKYGGGGHRGAGTCEIAPEKAGKVVAELIEVMNADG